MSPPPEVQHYQNELASVFRARRVILIGGTVAGLAPLARQLVALGAERPLIIGSNLGTGELPDEDDAEWVSLEISAGSALEAIRFYEAELTHLPDVVRRRIDEYDPNRAAIALGAMVLSDVPAVGGRPRYGARPRNWSALEDKVAIDAFWDAIEVPRAQSEIVPPTEAALLEAAARLDDGQGTVWAADAREGVNAGAEEVRWIRSDDDVQPALAHLAPRCDRVRVMPFLDGIPCSIHGMVLPDGVAVFRPVELLVLRRPEDAQDAWRLRDAGVSTFWDPPAEARDQMRDVARKTARALASRVGFRGAFSVDGVLTARGFLPTELNPRIATGLSVLGDAAAGVPLVLLAIAAQAGETLDFLPAQIEELVVSSTDARRAGAGCLVLSGKRSTSERHALVELDGSYRLARPGEPAHAELVIGPSEVGGFALLTPAPERMRVGASIAERVARGFQVADRELSLGIGPLEPAQPAE